MKKSIFAKQKSPGRPATGQIPMLGFRATDELRGKIVHWAELQSDQPKLSEAIRRLVEIGLSVKPTVQVRSKTAQRAAQLAAKVVENKLQPDLPQEERNVRKRSLLKGPSMIRDMRKARG